MKNVFEKLLLKKLITPTRIYFSGEGGVELRNATPIGE